MFVHCTGRCHRGVAATGVAWVVQGGICYEWGSVIHPSYRWCGSHGMCHDHMAEDQPRRPRLARTRSSPLTATSPYTSDLRGVASRHQDKHHRKGPTRCAEYRRSQSKAAWSACSSPCAETAAPADRAEPWAPAVAASRSWRGGARNDWSFLNSRTTMARCSSS
jgi:hypothetical protein